MTPKQEEALAQPEQETQGYREAAQLAKWLFKTHYAQQEHYASGRVIWGLCDTTSGVISQIDNMVCKLVLPKEPEQEPVAFVKGCNRGQWEIFPAKAHQIFGIEQPLYTTPPQRKPLSEEEIGAILEDVNAYGTRLYTFARAIEAAHGIKGEA